MSREFWIGLALATAVFLVLALIGGIDYEDAKAEEAHYNDMVCHGYWPDYERRKPKCD